MRGILLSIIILAALAHAAVAQQDTLAIDDIVISENRIDIPFSDASRNIEVITNVDIQRLNPGSINELLQTVAGVDIRQRGVNGVQADLSIRGGTFEQALVLINGIKMIDPQTGHHMMNLPVNLEDIARIEVLKGPGARVYGQNAFAGAINIVTKTSSETGLRFGMDVGDHGLFNGQLSASLPIGDYRQTISYGYNSSDGYRYNTDYDIHNVFYQGQTSVGRGTFNLMGGYTSRDFGANGFYGRESFTDQYESVQTGFVSAGLDARSGTWRIAPRLSWRNNKDNWQFKREDPEFFQNFHTTNVLTGELNLSKTHSLGILGVGVEYNAINIESNNLGEHTRGQFGAHLENRFVLADDRLDITPGLFLLSISDFGTQIYPGLDFGYRVNNSWKAFLTAGATSRIPTYTDLYYEDRGNVGNPNLQEETAFTTEVGVKYRSAKMQVTASVFNRSAMDQIDWYRATADDKWTPDNFTEATYNGLDLSATWHMPESFLSRLRVNYLYLDASFEESDFAFSRNVLENLKHQLVIAPTFDIADSWQLNALLKYNNRVSLDNYTTVDANLSYTTGSMRYYLRAANLFDTAYKETNLVTMPGRWIVFGLRNNL